MNVAQLRSWLLPSPRPVSVRVKCGKETHELNVAGQTWAKVAQSIIALEPDRIEALDAEGKVLRVCKPQETDDDEAPAEASPAPVVPAHAYDPETLRFELVAKLLADAYKHSTNVAFDKIVDIVNAQNRRAESLERSLQASERLLRRQIEDQADEIAEAREEAEKGPLGGLGDLVQGFIGGQQKAAEGAPPPAKTTNGKGH